jgi:BASS family bile acid:Na+ symporter
MPEIVRTLVTLASSQLVILLALGVGLSIRIEDLEREVRNPVLWRTLLVALAGVPLLAIGVAVVLPLGPVARGVLVLMSVSPGAPLLINKARTGSGNVTVAVAMAVALTLAALVTLPITLSVLNRIFPLQLRASVPAMLNAIVPRLLVPLAGGAVARRAWPRGATILAPVVRVLFLIALALVSISALTLTLRELGRVGPWAWLAMLIVTFGATILGDLVGGPEPRDRLTAAYAVVLGNPAVGIQVATFSYPSLKAVPVIAAYVVLRVIFVMPYALVSRRRLARSSHG